MPSDYQLLTSADLSRVTLGGDLVVPDGARVWIGPPILDGESTVEVPVEVSKVCGYTVKGWNSVRIAHPGYLCYDIYGNCVPITTFIREHVSCENTCSNPATFACVAYDDLTGHVHVISMPSASADTSCMEPCNSQGQCAGECD